MTRDSENNNNNRHPQNEAIVFTSAFDILNSRNTIPEIITLGDTVTDIVNVQDKVKKRHALHPENQKQQFLHLPVEQPAIWSLRFPFDLKPDQVKGVEAWLANRCRGSLIYSSGTGKTEIAFECARRAAGLELRERPNFNILLLVPRIVLVEQNCKRLLKYNISSDKIGRYYGEQKVWREITVSTYNSASYNLDMVREADMVICDEMHLAASHAPMFKRILETITGYPQKAVLGLTATIDESDPRNCALLKVLPPVRKYLIADAVKDGRLARPVVVPMQVTLTEKEQLEYDGCTGKIRNISRRFKRYDSQSMLQLLRMGGFPSWQARAWFLNVRKRKSLLASADDKLATAVELIANKHRGQKIMVFSETLESVRKLRSILKEKEGLESRVIDSTMPSFKRQKTLSQWGTKFYPLLSVHTLEIGYDVPEAAIEIILASTSNMNQVVQRIGRVVRKSEGKEIARVYVIYASGTKDDNMLTVFTKAAEQTHGEMMTSSA